MEVIKNRQKPEQGGQELDLIGLMRYLLSKTHWILIIGLVCAAAVFYLETALVPPKYESYVTMYVYNNPEIKYSQGAISGSDIQAAESLAETYKVILKSNVVLDAVSQKIEKTSDIKLSRTELREMLDVSTENDTQIMRISVINEQPEMAQTIAAAFASAAPEQITRVTKAGGVEVVDNAEYPKQPVSPHFVRDSVLGFLSGAMIAVIWLAIKLLADNTIYTPEDIGKIDGLTVLGQIPNIDGAKAEESWKLIPSGILQRR